MNITVRFKLNTDYEYGARLVGNVSFLKSRGKSVPIRLTHHTLDMKTIEKADIFIPERLMAEVPKFFIGELKMLSPQIESVTQGA